MVLSSTLNPHSLCHATSGIPLGLDLDRDTHNPAPSANVLGLRVLGLKLWIKELHGEWRRVGISIIAIGGIHGGLEGSV